MKLAEALALAAERYPRRRIPPPNETPLQRAAFLAGLQRHNDLRKAQTRRQVLDALSTRVGATISDLVHPTGLAYSTIWDTLKRLETDGLAEKADRVGNERHSRWRLTGARP